MERFWSKVAKRESGCWEWTARRDRAGYGEFRINQKTSKAHRVSFAMANPLVEIDGLCILHKCDNPCCVNPDHLFVGTHADNVADKCRKGRGRCGPSPGSKNGSSKLTEDQVRQIRSFHGVIKQDDLATMFGVSQAVISIILLKKGWKHVV